MKRLFAAATISLLPVLQGCTGGEDALEDRVSTPFVSKTLSQQLSAMHKVFDCLGNPAFLFEQKDILSVPPDGVDRTLWEYWHSEWQKNRGPIHVVEFGNDVKKVNDRESKKLKEELREALKDMDRSRIFMIFRARSSGAIDAKYKAVASEVNSRISYERALHVKEIVHAQGVNAKNICLKPIGTQGNSRREAEASQRRVEIFLLEIPELNAKL